MLYYRERRLGQQIEILVHADGGPEQLIATLSKGESDTSNAIFQRFTQAKSLGELQSEIKTEFPSTQR